MVHGSFAGIYADDLIALEGNGAFVRVWGSSSLVANTKTANGSPVIIEEMGNHIVYENGVLRKIDTPYKLDIGDLSYLQDELFEDISGNGWTWDWEAAQLTLHGCSVGYIECRFDSSLQVVLEEGTHNIVSGLWAGDSLYISGSGILVTNALQAIGSSSAIFIDHSVVLAEYFYANGLNVQGGLFFTGSNHTYTLQKDTVIQRNLVLPSNNKYIIPAGRKVTIAQGAALTVNGELVNNGTITGNVIAGNGNSSKISFVSLVPSSKTIYVNQSFTPAVAITPVTQQTSRSPGQAAILLPPRSAALGW
jgi:hypothetical protein